HGRSSGHYFRCRDGCSWQVDHGMPAGDQGIHHRRVHARTAGNSVRNLRGTSAAWLHDLLQPHVDRLVVCDPRKAALLKEGNKSDRTDARKLAEMLRTQQLHSVYHGEHGVRTLKELGRSYLTITKGCNSKSRLQAASHCSCPLTYSVDSISNPHASSRGSGMYLEFLLRRAHSRKRVERRY